MALTIIFVIAMTASAVFAPSSTPLGAAGTPAAQARTTAPNPKFIPVDGATLEDRRRAAAALGRADATASHYWIAYGFDVRPGVAIDAEVRGEHGVTRVEGVSMTADGKTIETRNLAVFLLYERNTAAPDRVEIYNLDRARGYDTYPVYWAGHGTADESFALMRGLLDARPSAWVAERAVVAVAVNADPRAPDVLESIVRSSQIERARVTALTWLGITSDRVAFLADRVRDESESLEVRKQATIAIGIGHAAGAIAALAGLLDAVHAPDVREQIVIAAGIHGQEDGAVDDESVDFLIRVAGADPDAATRRQAIFWLSQKAGKRSLDALVEQAANETTDDVELQKHAVFALSQRPKDEAVPVLMRLAKTHRSAEVRRTAMFWLGQIDDERVLPFFREILAR
jgi:hypothetical protein